MQQIEELMQLVSEMNERLEQIERVEVTGKSSAYTITNDSTDRAYDANSTTVAELADVLATLIRDLAVGNLPTV